MSFWGTRVPPPGGGIPIPNVAPIPRETITMDTRWTRQTRRVLALAVLALALAVSGTFGPVVLDEAAGTTLVTAAHACGSQGSGC